APSRPAPGPALPRSPRVVEPAPQPCDDLGSGRVLARATFSLRGGQTSLDELVLHRPVPNPFLDGIDNERGERLAGAQQTLGLAAKSRLDAKGRQGRGLHVFECIAVAMEV